MQVQASNASENIMTAVLQNKNVKSSEEGRTNEIEKTKRDTQGHSGVQRTGVEKSIGLYQAEPAVQDAITKRMTEIKDKLNQLVNGVSPLELLGIRQEGYSLNASDVEKIETVIDQIQVKLAAYCDSYQPGLPIDSEMAEEILGNAALAESVTKNFQEYRVPVTEDNLKDAKEAIAMAQEIETPTRAQAGYMAANEIEPTIENLYCTEHTPVPEQSGKPLSDQEWEQLKSQAEKLLAEAGLEPTEENLDTSRWLIEQGIPMDKDMLRAFSGILSVDGSMSTDEIVFSIAQAMAKGKEAREALMTGEGYTQERVEAAFAKLKEEQNGDITDAEAFGSITGTTGEMEELTRRRRLEEIRLMMTTEAGLSLLKKGIEIETLSLSELVDALKEQEQEYYKALYHCDGLEASPEKLEQLSEVSRTMEALKALPSYVVGMMAESQSVQAVTMEATYEAGVPLKATLDAAHSVYDALMTAPDKEYGDSLTKAFQNIDDILADMDRETTPENRRVIKILAYNQMELDEQNMELVTELDREYQYLLKNLTPRVTMHMIEHHINPLNTEIHELNDQIEAIKEEIGPESSETYSEFLWKLEKKTDLSKEDRDAYIGLYRLLNQVDRTGEAAIGALASQNREVTLDHLLSAVRSRKAKGMDISVDDEFGFLTDRIQKGVSISEQLKGFVDTMQEDTGAYEEEQKQLMQNLSKESETLRLLAQSEEPVSLDNMQAAHTLALEEHSFLQRVQNLGRQSGRSFTEAMGKKELLQENYEELLSEAEGLAEDAMKNPDNNRETIEDMRLFHRTIALTAKLASFEDYHMPVEIEGETCAVHVRLLHRENESGRAELSMEFPDGGKLRAEFQLSEENLSGFVLTDSKSLAEQVKSIHDEFVQAMEEAGLPRPEMTYIEGSELPAVPDNKTENQADTAKLYQITKEFIMAAVRNVKNN